MLKYYLHYKLNIKFNIYRRENYMSQIKPSAPSSPRRDNRSPFDLVMLYTKNAFLNFYFYNKSV